LLTNTTGADNVAVGLQSLYANTTGCRNVAVGYASLVANTSGIENVAVGRNTLDANTTGTQNTAIGNSSLTANTTGAHNIAVGKDSLATNTTGQNNVAVGFVALTSVTTAYENVGVGREALYNVTTGGCNVAVGRDAGRAITTGSNNIMIGRGSCADTVSTSNSTSIGENVVSISGSVTFGNGSTDSRLAFGATSITAPSDMRLKEDIQDDTAGLSFINDLRPVTYRWKKEKDIPEEMRTYVAGSEKRYNNDKVNHGFVAQEVKQAIDNHPELKDGFSMWAEEDTLDGRQRLAEGALIPILVNAIKELTARVKELEDE